MRGVFVILVFIVAAFAIVATNICIVPQASAWIVERLGKYQATWDAGLHIRFRSLTAW